MADVITHMLVKYFYEYHAKESLQQYLLYFPAKFFWGFVKIRVHPWECVTHVNVISHVCRSGKKVENHWISRMPEKTVWGTP
jgi:hypothetical protein